MVGIVLLLVTFAIACVHLGEINILPVPSFTASIGGLLSPILEAAIRVLYLGLMGFIATKVTARGLTVLLYSRLEQNMNSQTPKSG